MNPVGKVLIVDDEAGLRHTLTRILRLAGCEVSSAADGYEALRLLVANGYHLVYLDIRLPGMNGLETLRNIRQQAPQLPVILLTAYGSLQTALEALRLGATDYLLKPVDPEVLVSRTRMVLQEQMVEQRKREIREQIERLRRELSSLEQQYPASGEAQPSAGAGLPAPNERFFKCGALILDLQARRGTLGERIISLPPATFDYLVVLARHAPAAVNYQALVTEAQGYHVDRGEARDLAKYHVHLLRQSLEADPKTPQRLHNVRGVGYRLLVD